MTVKGAVARKKARQSPLYGTARNDVHACKNRIAYHNGVPTGGDDDITKALDSLPATGGAFLYVKGAEDVILSDGALFLVNPSENIELLFQNRDAD